MSDIKFTPEIEQTFNPGEFLSETEHEFQSKLYSQGLDGKSAYEIAVVHGFEGSEQEWLESLNGQDGQDGYTPIKGVDYFTDDDKNEMVEDTKDVILPSILQPSYVNNDISVIDTGLTYSRGLLIVKVVGSTLWIIDSGVYNFTENFKTSKNRTVLEFTLPKSISDRLPNANGVYGTTGTICYYPALAYENVTYTTFNCQSYLKRSKIGETEDTFQVVYTGLSDINGGGLCGFHLRMQLILV